MKVNLKKSSILTAMAVVTMATFAHAATIVSYNVAPAGSVSGTVAPNVSATVLNRGAGVGISGGAAGEMKANFWSSSPNPADLHTAGDYFAFSVTVDSGYTADLSDLRSGIIFNTFGPGPNVGLLYSSLDSYAAPVAVTFTAGAGLYTGNPNPVYDWNVTLPAAFDAVTGTVQFRIMGLNATGDSGEFGIANQTSGLFRLEGTVTAIPEPATITILTSIAGCMLLRRRA
jgi:hypothetical protein